MYVRVVHGLARNDAHVYASVESENLRIAEKEVDAGLLDEEEHVRALSTGQIKDVGHVSSRYNKGVTCGYRVLVEYGKGIVVC